MLLYSGTAKDFVIDTTKNAIVDHLVASFEREMGHKPSDSERHSWQNSLKAMALVVVAAGFQNQGVVIEYRLPGTSRRLDFMISGFSSDNKKQAVIIELKQWEKTQSGDGDKVVTFVGKRDRDVLHPSVQVSGYKQFLTDQLVVLHEEETSIRLSACAYLHNYTIEKNDCLFEQKFENVVKANPVFSKNDVDSFITYLTNLIPNGDNGTIIEEVVQSKAKPSKKLLEEVHRIVKENSNYVLLDEQVVAYNRIIAEVKHSTETGEKAAIIVRGGPGTGKSVIALNVMAELSKSKFNTHYVTGSRAFTETIRKILGVRGAQQVKFFNSYMAVEPSSVDVMVCDEAHRIRKTSNNMYTKKDKRSTKSQLEELFDASKVTVFFIDDRQIVRPDEIGSSALITEFANARGIRLFDYTLKSQFRCSGSDAFINWINHTLGIEETAHHFWEAKNSYEFKIFDTPEELEKAIHAKVDEKAKARMAAGFCWKWSDPDSSGNLLDDVVIGDWKRPWDAKPGATRLAKGIPLAALWAYDPNGIGQIGCVYTAQGFEFDYIGVIIGKDLIYRNGQGWIGVKEESCDSVVKRSKEKFVDLVKNTYRVLLTRGMKGCYVYFMDKETRQYFESCIKN